MPTHLPTLLLAAASGLCAPLAAQSPVAQLEPLRTPRHIAQLRQTPLKLTECSVQVVVDGNLATTTIRQSFVNPSPRMVEADWLLPLPRGAHADRLSLQVDGKKLEGEVLDAGQASRIYQEIVRRRRDPALLEYHGDGCLRARAFPIGGNGGKAVVTVRYSQTLTPRDTVYSWRLPLRSMAALGTPPERSTIDVQVRTQQKLVTLGSSLPEFDCVRTGDHTGRASFEIAGRLPAQDPEMTWAFSDQDFGLELLAYRPDPKKLGTFSATFSPRFEWPESKSVRRALSFAIDVSGSMKGEKIVQAKAALRQFLGSLQTRDFFNIVPFSTATTPFFPTPVAATEENLTIARAKIEALEARGGTNFEAAIQFLVQPLDLATKPDDQLLPVHVLLTDGMPTVGATDVNQLLGMTRGEGACRTFVFGVGDDVNTRLLDTLAAETRGDRDYVRPGENIELATSALFTKLSGPVMTDVKVDFGAAEASDLTIQQFPDLFRGSQLTIFGRYCGTGSKAVRLTGTVNGKTTEYVFERSFPELATKRDALPSLWAARRVAELLDAMRRNGQNPELVQAVRDLGRTYGIVTPFTSHLVVEENDRLARASGFFDAPNAPGRYFGTEEKGRRRVRRELRRAGIQTDPTSGDLEDLIERLDEEADAGRKAVAADAPTAGAVAVLQSLELKRLKNQVSVPSGAGLASSMVSQRVGAFTLFLIGGQWVDGKFDAKVHTSTRKIDALSDEYFALLAANPTLRKVFAFSTAMTLIIDGAAVQITPAAE